MARVKAFTVAGLELWFYSGDHEPPHFHARKLGGEWVARIHLLQPRGSMIELLRPAGARIGGRYRKALEQGVEANRMALLAEWEAAQAG